MPKGFFLSKHKQRGYGVYTIKSWKKGDIISSYEGNVIPTCMVTQDHITLSEYFSFEWRKESLYSYVNHSCNPNCHIDLSNGVPSLVALRDISSDEELAYNYNTIELDLHSSFPCHCGAKTCIGWIKGFLYLTPKQEQSILHLCSPYIQEMQKEYAKNRE